MRVDTIPKAEATGAVRPSTTESSRIAATSPNYAHLQPDAMGAEPDEALAYGTPLFDLIVAPAASRRYKLSARVETPG
jgi:hypothetical protein